MFQKLDTLDRKLRARIEKVAATARKCGETGIVAWTARAAEDALVLGRIRDKDMDTLARLERTFASDFYSNSGEELFA